MYAHMLSCIPEDLVHELLSTLAQKLFDSILDEMKASKNITLKTRNSGLLVCNITSIRSQYAMTNAFKCNLFILSYTEWHITHHFDKPNWEYCCRKKDSDVEKKKGTGKRRRKSWFELLHCILFTMSCYSINWQSRFE